MPDPRGFLKHPRREPEKEPVASRVKHSREFERALPVIDARVQATRCMSCGVPFCHTGCPLGNVIPDCNAAVDRERMDQAAAILDDTNNFPEITGRICPAPCEGACVAGIGDAPVAIKAIERTIGDHAIEHGALAPRPAPRRTRKRVAIVGSGPAGLACAQELARAGHDVTVFEKDDRVGGLLRYGIPDFKLEKHIVDARAVQLAGEHITFETGVEVGKTISLETLRGSFDAVVLATGAGVPRDLVVPGRDATGVHFAMEFLVAANRAVAHRVPTTLSAEGKHVIVIGGGDTGSDCVGTSHRQGARSVTQLEIMPRPPATRASETPWPLWPLMLRTSSSQEEGGAREFAVHTKRFVTDAGRVVGLELESIQWTGANESGRRGYEAVSDSARVLPADLVLLALGFTGPDPSAWLGTSLATDARGNVNAGASKFETNVRGVFACGDARRGQSLVVWAIWEGRETARAVDLFLMKRSSIATTPAFAL